jgi:hypothetical protein
MLNLQYSWIAVIASIIGSMIGTVGIHQLMKRTNRNSIIVFALGIILALSAILIPMYTINDMVSKLKKGIDVWKFRKGC